MTKYRLFFSQTAGAYATVEADSLDDAIERAYDELPSGVCAQCSGWGRNSGISLDGDWILDEEAANEDYREAKS